MQSDISTSTIYNRRHNLSSHMLVRDVPCEGDCYLRKKMGEKLIIKIFGYQV